MNTGLENAITSAAGPVGDILGLVGGIGQSIGLGNLEKSAGGGLNETIGQEQGIIGELQSLGIDTSQFAQELGTSGTGYQTSAAGEIPGITGAAGAMQASPYLGALAGYGTQMAPGANPYLGQTGAAASGLQTYNALTPQQLGLLATTGGNAALSAANTMRTQAGGVPNAGLAYQQGVTTAGQTGMQTAAQLGANVASENLQAREAALGGYESGAGTYLGSLEGGAGTVGQAGSQYLQGQQGAGGLYGSAADIFAGLGSTDISGANTAYGTSTQAYGQGLQGYQNIGQNYLGLLGLGMGAQQQQPGLGNLGALFGL